MISANNTTGPDNKDGHASSDLKKISERDAQIFGLFSQGKTLQEVGDAFKITRERVRQIVNVTIKRIAQNESLSKGIIIDTDIFTEDISRRRQTLKESIKMAAKPPIIPKERRWSKYYASCRQCGTTTIPHVKRGLCEDCTGIFGEKRREEIIGKHSFKCDACGMSRAKARLDYGRDLYITKQKSVLCRRCYRKKMGKLLGNLRLYEWSRAYPKCKSCGTTEVPHVKKGLCENCCDFYSKNQRESLIQKHAAQCDLCHIDRATAQKKYNRDLFATRNEEVYCWGCFLKTARSRFIKK